MFMIPAFLFFHIAHCLFSTLAFCWNRIPPRSKRCLQKENIYRCHRIRLAFRLWQTHTGPAYRSPFSLTVSGISWHTWLILAAWGANLWCPVYNHLKTIGYLHLAYLATRLATQCPCFPSWQSWQFRTEEILKELLDLGRKSRGYFVKAQKENPSHERKPEPYHASILPPSEWKRPHTPEDNPC